MGATSLKYNKTTYISNITDVRGFLLILQNKNYFSLMQV